MEKVYCHCDLCGSRLAEFRNEWIQVEEGCFAPKYDAHGTVDLVQKGEVKEGVAQTLYENCQIHSIVCAFCGQKVAIQLDVTPDGHIFDADQLVFSGHHINLMGGRRGEEVDFIVTESIELESLQGDHHSSAQGSVDTEGIADNRTEFESPQRTVDMMSSDGHRIGPAADGKVSCLEERVSQANSLYRDAPANLTENMVSRVEMETRLEALSQAHSVELEALSRDAQAILMELRSNMVSRLEFESHLQALSQAHSEDIHLLKCQLNDVRKGSHSVSPLRDSPQPDRNLKSFFPAEASQGSAFPGFLRLPLAEALEEVSGDEDHNNAPSHKALDIRTKSRRDSRPPGFPLKKAQKLLPKSCTALPQGKISDILDKKPRAQMKSPPSQAPLPPIPAPQPQLQLKPAAMTTWQAVVQAYPWVSTTFRSIPDHPAISWLAKLPAQGNALGYGSTVLDGKRDGFLLSNIQQRRFNNLKAALSQSAGVVAE